MYKTQLKTQTVAAWSSLAALVATVPMLSGCMSWDDIVHIRAEVVASDGVTPVPFLNLDAYDLNFIMDDDTLIGRRIDFSAAQQLGEPLSTDSTGLWELVTPDLQLSIEKEVRECNDICVDRDDQSGACIEYVRDCRDVLKTFYYGVGDIHNNTAQISFRLAGGATVTVVGQKIEHGYTEVEHDDNTGERAWKSFDKFVTPLDPSSVAQSNSPQSHSQSLSSKGSENAFALDLKPGLKVYMGAPKVVRYEDASAEMKAKVDAIIKRLKQKKPPVPTPGN